MKSLLAFFQNLTLAKKILLLITPLLSMVISIQAALLGLLILVLIDLFTGIRKGLKEKNISGNPFKKQFWLSIKSYLLRQTWRKTYEYVFGIIAIIVLESLVFGSTSIVLLEKTYSLSEIAVLLCAAIEVWSIYENIEAVTGNNILKKMSGFLPEPFKKLISKSK